MLQYLEDLSTDRPDLVDEANSTFLDLGTGNAQLLVGVREAGFEGTLTGLDYSEAAVSFAASVVDKACREQEWPRAAFEMVRADFLGDDTWRSGKEWDVVLDKGTLDAIALADSRYPDPAGAAALTGVQVYPLRVHSLLARNGVFLITSCNFTETELEAIMAPAGLAVFGRVRYPTFEFGGSKGQAVCTVAFRRTDAEI